MAELLSCSHKLNLVQFFQNRRFSVFRELSDFWTYRQRKKRHRLLKGCRQLIGGGGILGFGDVCSWKNYQIPAFDPFSLGPNVFFCAPPHRPTSSHVSSRASPRHSAIDTAASVSHSTSIPTKDSSLYPVLSHFHSLNSSTSSSPPHQQPSSWPENSSTQPPSFSMSSRSKASPPTSSHTT